VNTRVIVSVLRRPVGEIHRRTPAAATDDVSSHRTEPRYLLAGSSTSSKPLPARRWTGKNGVIE
jgi:hypothetical protein